jgi:hypothetical protein
MKLKLGVVAAAMLLVHSIATARAELDPQSIRTLPRSTIEAKLPTEHPLA